jgi:hypothetical protein
LTALKAIHADNAGPPTLVDLHPKRPVARGIAVSQLRIYYSSCWLNSPPCDTASARNATKDASTG